MVDNLGLVRDMDLKLNYASGHLDKYNRNSHTNVSAVCMLNVVIKQLYEIKNIENYINIAKLDSWQSDIESWLNNGMPSVKEIESIISSVNVLLYKIK